MLKATDDHLTPNKYSRPGTRMKKIKGVVIHWVANANTSAKANRNFFESRKEGGKGYGSAHYIIGLDGTLLSAIPDEEMAYHVGAKSYTARALDRLSSYPNNCTIGIECTHIDDSGLMTKHTYEALVSLTSDLCRRYSLNPLKDLYRHFDITGKDCHKWFVDNPTEWERFKAKVNKELNYS